MATYLSPNPNLVRLQSAVLCANCEVISEGTNGHCSACGSQALLALSRILGGPLTPAVPFHFGGCALVAENRPGQDAFVLVA
jgi:hypothetical protein